MTTTKVKAFLGACTLALALPALAAAADGAPAAREARALSALAGRYHEAQLRFDPVYSGTLNGDNRYDDLLPVTIAPGQRRARFAMYRDVRRALAAIDRAALPEADALTWDVLARELDGRLAAERFDDHLLPLQQMDSIPLLLATFAGGQADQPLKTVAQHEAFLKRLAALPAWDAQAVENMREGIRRGIVQPRPVVVALLAQLGPMCSARVDDNPFLAPVRGATAGFAEADRTRLDAAYRATVLGRVAPAMCRLRDFVEHDYLPAARGSVGWSALPDGAAWYRQCVRDQTTTELDPDEIHAMGLAEVARIQGELARVAPRLGYTGDPKQLLAWVRGNPAFLPFRDADLILGAYRDIDGEVRAQLPTLFHRLPRAGLDIRLEPELTRATASDHYTPPAQDGSRPGVFWAVVNDPAIYDSSIMTALPGAARAGAAGAGRALRPRGVPRPGAGRGAAAAGVAGGAGGGLDRTAALPMRARAGWQRVRACRYALAGCTRNLGAAGQPSWKIVRSSWEGNCPIHVSPLPTAMSASSRFERIIALMRSSNVPRVTNRCTCTLRCWPMR